jgi:bifunctional DNA-binding transcriptional regulator/antitoxin component of YhaV-PrlF toxin-antitoxin module
MKIANKSSVMQQKNGQMILTIPKAIAEAMRLKKGEEIEWIFDKGDVIVRRV